MDLLVIPDIEGGLYLELYISPGLIFVDKSKYINQAAGSAISRDINIDLN
jgi:hypothetical protein